MDWKKAKQRTLGEWLRIRSALTDGDALQLVTDINAVCALCEKAREVAGSAAERCSQCIAFGDTKICEDYRFKLSELILDRDEAAATVLLEEIIQRVRDAPLPDETPAPLNAAGTAL